MTSTEEHLANTDIEIHQHTLCYIYISYKICCFLSLIAFRLATESYRRSDIHL